MASNSDVLWPWIAASVVIHGLIVVGMYVFLPDDETLYSDGFVTVELIQALPGTAFKTGTKTDAASYVDRLKNIEPVSSKVVKIEPRLAQKAAEIAPAPNIETDMQMLAKAEDKAASDMLASNQKRMEMQQAQSQRKWERVRARLEESKWYPASARRRGIEGDVELGFALNREGYTRYSTVLTGSGYAILDQAALETVKRAEPFPADGGEYRFKLRFRRL